MERGAKEAIAVVFVVFEFSLSRTIREKTREKKVWLEKKSVERNLEIGDGAGRGSKTRRACGARSPSQGPRRGGKRFLVTFSNRVYISFS